MNANLVDKKTIQDELFARMSDKFADEVPMYDKGLEINHITNKTVTDLLSKVFPGFQIKDEQIEKDSSNRHGAIRVARDDEYQLITGFFSAFGMNPHATEPEGFYNLADLEGRSQPITAVAFRSSINPAHRVFTSLLRTDFFDEKTKEELDSEAGKRNLFTDRAKKLIRKNELQGGLTREEADELIEFGVEKLFAYRGEARNKELYDKMKEAKFSIASDIVCFENPHINHFTPNTFDIDMYTNAMKFGLGEISEEEFKKRSTYFLTELANNVQNDFLELTFNHISSEDISKLQKQDVTGEVISRLVDEITNKLSNPELDLSKLNHNGYKDHVEGAVGVPVFLRQSAYKALTEKVTFIEGDGQRIDSEHTARFGEIEQRFYAATPEGREVYNRALEKVNGNSKKGIKGYKAENEELFEKDYVEYDRGLRKIFQDEFGAKTLNEMYEKGYVYVEYRVTEKGRENIGNIETAKMDDLIEKGYVSIKGQREEDFLPFSAAGIFAANLGEQGTISTAKDRKPYTREQMEEIIGKPITQAEDVHLALQERSKLSVIKELGLEQRLSNEFKQVSTGA